MSASSPVPRVSVVIPTFRRPGPTVRAVRSVLAQTETDFEIVVVDDGSEDGTAEAVEALGDRRVRVLRSERNQGVSAARNRGVSEARAPFIALLDSDDELLPESLERRLECLEQNGASPFVYSRIHYALSKKVRPIAPRRPLGPEDDFFEALIVGQGLNTSAMMARTDALRACPFDTRLAGVDDWDVALKLARLGPPAFVPQALTIVHAEDEAEGGRVTTSLNPESERLFIELHRGQFTAHPKAEAVVYHKLGMRAVRTGKRALAEQCLCRAAELDPEDRRARTIVRLLRLGLAPLLPALLRLRWRVLLALGRVG